MVNVTRWEVWAFETLPRAGWCLLLRELSFHLQRAGREACCAEQLAGQRRRRRRFLLERIPSENTVLGHGAQTQTEQQQWVLGWTSRAVREQNCSVLFK